MSIYPPETPTPRAAEHQLSIGRSRPQSRGSSSTRADPASSTITLGAGFGLELAICYTPAVAAVQPWFDQSRDCVRHRLVGHWARYGLDAAAREMADRRRGLAGSSHPDRARGGRFRLPGLELDPASPGFAADLFVSTVLQLSSQACPRPEVSAALPGRVPVISSAPRPDRSYDPSRCSRGRSSAGRGVVDLDPRLWLSRRPAGARPC